MENPNPLAEHVGVARRATVNALGGATGYVQEGASRWITFERRVERELRVGPLPHAGSMPSCRVGRATNQAEVQAKSRVFSPATSP